MIDRKCPECQEIMKIENYNGLEINTCHTCMSVFLDYGEIKRLVDSVQCDEIFKRKWDTQFEKNLPTDDVICPNCTDEVMDRREYIYGSGNHIHFCKACGGIYLDAGQIDGIQHYEANRVKWSDAKKLYMKAEMDGLMASRQQDEILEDLEDGSASGMTGAAYKVWKKFF